MLPHEELGYTTPDGVARFRRWAESTRELFYPRTCASHTPFKQVTLLFLKCSQKGLS